MLTETIAWIDPQVELPDDDILVLVIEDDGDSSTAILTDGVWYDYATAHCYGFTRDVVINPPQYWAQMPIGPVALRSEYVD
jgi:hypothetical protein